MVFYIGIDAMVLINFQLFCVFTGGAQGCGLAHVQNVIDQNLLIAVKHEKGESYSVTRCHVEKKVVVEERGKVFRDKN